MHVHTDYIFHIQLLAGSYHIAASQLITLEADLTLLCLLVLLTGGKTVITSSVHGLAN